VFGFHAEVERVHGFLVVGEGLGHGADDGGFAVAAERRLQNTCDLTITV